VDKFYFPIDFIVLDTELVPDPTKLIPVILKRPFLATANACKLQDQRDGGNLWEHESKAKHFQCLSASVGYKLVFLIRHD